MKYLLIVLSLILCGCGSDGGGSPPSPPEMPTTFPAQLVISHIDHPTDLYYSPSPYGEIVVEVENIGGEVSGVAPLRFFMDGMSLGAEALPSIAPGEAALIFKSIWNTRQESSAYPGPWEEEHEFRVEVEGSSETFFITYHIGVAG